VRRLYWGHSADKTHPAAHTPVSDNQICSRQEHDLPDVVGRSIHAIRCHDAGTEQCEAAVCSNDMLLATTAQPAKP